MRPSILASFSLILIPCTFLLLLPSCGKKGSTTPTTTDSASAVCPAPSESVALTKSSSWNQSVVLAGEGTVTNAREISLTLSATNSSGIVGYYLSESDATPAVTDSGWVTVDSTATLATTTSLTLSAGDGSKTIYGWFKDSAAEISPVSCLAVVLDTGAPTGTLSLAGGATSTGSLSIAAAITGTSSSSSIIAYALSETNSTPALNSSLWNNVATPSTSVSVSTSFALAATTGAHTVYGWFKTESGQISSAFSAGITFTLPTVASGATPVVKEGVTVNSNSTITASLSINSGATSTTSRSVSLALSGLGSANINGYLISESSTTPAVTDSGWVAVTPSSSLSTTISNTLSSGDGAKTVYLYLKDNLNTVASASALITLDGTAPTGTLKLDSGAKLTVDATVAAVITGSDSIGITGYYISSSSTTPGVNDTGWTAITSTTSLSTSANRTLTAPLKGLKTQYLWLKDAAGNVSSTLSDGIEMVAIYSTNSGNDIGSYTSIAVDASNTAYITNYRADDGDLLYHVLVNGSLGAISLTNLLQETGDIGAGSSIAIDSNNKLHIAYRDTTNSKLKYATNASGSWVKETIEAGGISPSIGVDSNNKVHISHQTNSITVRYATNLSGSWAVQTVSTYGIDPFAPSSLAIGPDNAIHILAGGTGNRLQYMTNKSGAWQEETIASGDIKAGPALVVSEGGIIYTSFGSGSTIRLGTNSGNGWSTVQIASEAGDSASVVVDSLGFIHVIYYDYTNGDLKYATNYSGSWTVLALDSQGNVGDTCDLAIDSNDRLHISYYDTTNGDLKYITTAD